MKLWSIMPPLAWERLQRDLVLRADGRRANRVLRSRYLWMHEQMRARKVPTDGRRYPLWAWVDPKPDLRHRGHLKPGTSAFCVEMVVDSRRALLSDFDGWSFVLSRDLVALTHAERDDFVSRKFALKGAARARGLPPAEVQGETWAALGGEIQASWPRIFDLAAMDAYFAVELPSRGRCVQACLDEFRLEDVVTATPFTAR